MEAKKGRVYLCTKDQIGRSDNNTYFKRGNLYFSEKDGYITNEYDLGNSSTGLELYLVPARRPEPGVLYKVINSNFLLGNSGLKEGDLIRFKEGDNVDVDLAYFYNCYEAQREPMEVIMGNCNKYITIKEDKVNSPKHYTSHPSGIECIEIAKHYDFCIGNAIKYLWRAGLKKEEGYSDKNKEVEDLRKAIWYITEKIKTLNGGNK